MMLPWPLGHESLGLGSQVSRLVGLELRLVGLVVSDLLCRGVPLRGNLDSIRGHLRPLRGHLRPLRGHARPLRGLQSGQTGADVGQRCCDCSEGTARESRLDLVIWHTVTFRERSGKRKKQALAHAECPFVSLQYTSTSHGIRDFMQRIEYSSPLGALGCPVVHSEGVAGGQRPSRYVKYPFINL